jgi:hypothetical protein
MKALFFSMLLMLAAACACGTAWAQGNYEIQVYASETVAPRTTMVELHSNYTATGQSDYVDGVAPTNHAVHETVEITQGITSWSELGFYLFTSERSGAGTEWVGDHIRPRVRAPEQWHWPVGVSISMEMGYQRPRFSPDTWTWEIRPIVDRNKGRMYWSINPAMERSWHGPAVREGVEFTPGVKVGWDFTRKVNAGVEYYGAYGDLRNIAAVHEQQQQIFLVSDLNLSPKWEINFGVGMGPTAATDRWIIKGILGRRFDWSHQRE